eukprot:TRINITY_DN746_c0_g1_i2.p2 TRINITY_DN746_c0_g1~~TRINITY_DN746_c0_g1_i2.p2  ORF type:complete len:112 (+),score=9.69 TRINITY_DN746_c0_g1_i2:439-774(+)
MRTNAASYAKGFAVLGGIAAVIECIIEKQRAKSDIYNHISSGFLTGSIIAVRAGPKAALIGGVGFAGFSAMFGYFMEARDPRSNYSRELKDPNYISDQKSLEETLDASYTR